MDFILHRQPLHPLHFPSLGVSSTPHEILIEAPLPYDLCLLPDSPLVAPNSVFCPAVQAPPDLTNGDPSTMVPCNVNNHISSPLFGTHNYASLGKSTSATTSPHVLEYLLDSMSLKSSTSSLAKVLGTIHIDLPFDHILSTF
ncbi:unnamed protein product [Ilex paraguariensis]|uniref:Uncharacterized protein n=2 Tax=Ilex paraguariensis TaxID=185542 RepID=A0ABC8S911_9AQUA